jgi:hypothetical protein
MPDGGVIARRPPAAGRVDVEKERNMRISRWFLLVWAGLAAISCSGSHDGTDAGEDADVPDAVEDAAEAPDDEECPAGLTRCEGRCVDLDVDHDHCGECGHACEAAQICTGGECTLECPPGETDCDGECVITTADHDHCGECGNACAPEQVCSLGDCTWECEEGLIECSGACVDILTNRYHCGACNDPCKGDELCIVGRCGGCGNGLCAASEGENPCSCPLDCGPCSGCCLAGLCYPGQTADACGEGSGECSVCGTDERCISNRCCGDLWRITIPDVSLMGIVVDRADGTIYVSGQTRDESKAYVAALDGCGEIIDDVMVSPEGTITAAAARVAVGAQVLAAGSLGTSVAPPLQEGAFYAFTRPPLALDMIQNLSGSGGSDEAWGIAVGSADTFWISGTAGTDLPASRPWMIKGTALGQWCGWDPYDGEVEGEGRDLVATGGSVLATGYAGVQAYVVKYAAADCSALPPCDCAPAFETRFSAPGANFTEGLDVAISGTDAFVAGYAESSTKNAPMIARIDLGDEDPTIVIFEEDETGSADFYSGLVVTSSSLFGVGANGYTSMSNLETAQAFVTRIRMSDLTRDFTMTPPDVGIFSDVAGDGESGVLCAGSSPEGGIVMRCTVLGDCP